MSASAAKALLAAEVFCTVCKKHIFDLMATRAPQQCICGNLITIPTVPGYAMVWAEDTTNYDFKFKKDLTVPSAINCIRLVQEENPQWEFSAEEDEVCDSERFIIEVGDYALVLSGELEGKEGEVVGLAPPLHALVRLGNEEGDRLIKGSMLSCMNVRPGI